jgi:hypothetical protein
MVAGTTDMKKSYHELDWLFTTILIFLIGVSLGYAW